MTTLIEKKLENYPAVYITDEELTAVLNISAVQRYGQVKRALQKGELVRIRRGLYYINKNSNQLKPHPLELAQKIYWPSYISMETALSYHGLLPEAVYLTTSATTKRNKIFKTPYGVFSYHKLPMDNFLLQVERKTENSNCYFVAQPWKAICDYIYCRKKNWQGLQPITNSLRIAIENLPPITEQELTELENYYQSNRISNFIAGVKREL